MERSPVDWRGGVRKGDKLAVSATYDTAHASWYESMGIMLLFMSDDTNGPDPFAQPMDQNGFVTHGHLSENDNHGGQNLPGASHPATLPGRHTLANRVAHTRFPYLPRPPPPPRPARRPPRVPP